ncbi:hypothetical protein SBBP2_1720008 [Burkholderiales bacterium]|nr:hypothetical protein SBBP2_1720008 [Burkholderiales bacterium]
MVWRKREHGTALGAALQWRRLEADLRKTPRYFGFLSNLWDGPTFAEHLRRCYGVDLGLRQCQRLFQQMGYRPRRLRGVPVSMGS